jgi:uncharacterized protein (DUF608 family)
MVDDGDGDATRREFLRRTASVGAAVFGSASATGRTLRGVAAATDGPTRETVPGQEEPRSRTYAGEQLSRVAFPMGGIGAGMICLEGTGALSHVSLEHRPDVFHEPCVFAALAITGPHATARVLEGPVPGWKLFGRPGAALGDGGASYGLPRFGEAAFTSHFPFGTVALRDAGLPVRVELTGWSPFTPGDADPSSLPVAGLEYAFTNLSATPVSAVFSFNARNFMKGPIEATPGGFSMGAPGHCFEAAVSEAQVRVDHAWFRGGWFDPLTIAWRDIAQGTANERVPVNGGAPGASLFVPFTLAAGATRTIAVRLAWYVDSSDLRFGDDPPGIPPTHATYVPWYAGRFHSLSEVSTHWREQYAPLREATARFTDCFYDSTLPGEVVEAAAANLSILKSPTILRQTDGRLWMWEGCKDDVGSCAGNCTHVWNYAQAIPHLFPALERTVRETEFGPALDAEGFQVFRCGLPIRPIVRQELAAADGQLGEVMKLYREWRISGDTTWLRGLWPMARRSLDYCIRTWDPDHHGWLVAPHHNTYDIEFVGPDGMCTSIYLGALRAAVLMGHALGDDVARYETLYAQGRVRMEADLFTGEYFIQQVDRTQTPDDDDVAPEDRALAATEGPKYQYGTGCLSDGVLGAWFAQVCGVGSILDEAKVTSHVKAVHRYNFVRDLSAHANTQRPAYAANREGGVVLCSWPKGGRPSLPFVYSDEVWTGIEYQVASHLIMLGAVEQGLEVVRTTRQRYDGRVRNPYNEYEYGHWYARALASYALLQGLSGARYDAVEQRLYLAPAVRGDFRAFLSTATGYGLVGVRRGKPFVEVRSGTIAVRDIAYTPRAGA